MFPPAIITTSSRSKSRLADFLHRIVCGKGLRLFSIALAGMFLFLPCLTGCDGKSKAAREQDLEIVDDQGHALKASHSFPKVDLRGYGAVSAQSWELKGKGANASLLRIDCQNLYRAQLTHAKYLSDLQLLPGVEKTKADVPSGNFTGYKIDGQGAILACRAANSVLILAGDSVDALGALLKKHIRGGGALSCKAEVEVPMWLDRWDKFGFRFYYSNPFKTPSGMTPEAYNPVGEFDFAAKLDRAGFCFWDTPIQADTAEGVSNNDRWNWAMEECARLKLPVGIQLSYTGQTWLANRYRSETMQKMPGFCGDRLGTVHDCDTGQGFPSWCSRKMRTAIQSQMQESVRYWNRYPNVTSWAHPDSEFQHGFDQMMEYGPVADASYRSYLKQEYGNIETVAKRWNGNADEPLRSWDQVRVPEFASFFGWGPSALDLTGEWRIQFQAPYVDGKQVPPPAEWLGEKFDDSTWPTMTAPGNDHAIFLLKDDPTKPKYAAVRSQQAVYRRNFTLPDGWQARNPKTWLYVWDFDIRYGALVSAYVNGAKAGDDVIRFGVRHWFAVEVTDLIKPGTNQVSLVLPDGDLGYRVYLSPTPPAQYPYMGEALNARWADFTGWLQWSRLQSLEDSVSMIRQVDPNRGISFFDKNSYAFWRDGTKRLCAKYGGEIHNTGYMCAIWADETPMLMRSSGLPFSVEPGEPAPSASALLLQLGLYSVEGIQGIDYFQHVGDVLWNNEVRTSFEENWKLTGLIGKYHAPQAEVALLLASNRWQMCEYIPQQVHPDSNAILSGGCGSWNLGEMIFPWFNRDAVSPLDFEDGNAAKYKILLDTNTSIMDEKLVGEIEKYVRNGGIFVTYVQTGRHTPTKPDAWPIRRLTGYRVAGIDPYRPDGTLVAERNLEVLPGQSVFPQNEWKNALPANGLSLVKESPDCVDLMRWADGSVAVGMRPLGKGYIVNVGAKFASTDIRRGHMEWTSKMFVNLLDYFKIARVPASFTGVADVQSVKFRHYISNNGLYDVWTLWNSTKTPLSLNFQLDSSNNAPFAINVKTGDKVSLDQFKKLDFSPLETKSFLTPRNKIGDAASEWFSLQRGWWQGTTKPKEEPLPEFKPKFALDLAPDWEFLPVKASDPVATWIASATPSENKTELRRLNVWTLDHPDVKHALFKKEITVPKEWANGEVRLWFLYDSGCANVTYTPSFVGQAKIYVDGEVIRDFQSIGVTGIVLKSFKPGTTHRLAVEIKGTGAFLGFMGGCWLNFVPNPADSIDLAGEWEASDDALVFNKRMIFPGEWNAYTVRRKVEIPENFKGKNVVAHIEFKGVGPQGVLINGKWLRKSFQTFGSRLDFNIAPWVKFGQSNEIELTYIADGRGQGPTRFTMTHVSLDMYSPEVFP